MANIATRHMIGLKHSLRGVCFVAPELERIGGYELATLALASALRDHGVSVLLVTVALGEVNGAGDADLIRINMRGQHTLMNAFPKLLGVLARNRSRFSVIHCPTFGYISGLAVLAGQALRRPTLVRVATENDVRALTCEPSFKSRLFFNVLRSAARVIAPSRAIREELLREGFSNERIVYSPNSVDVDRFRPAAPSEKREAKSALGIAVETPVIGTVARLVERKGIDVLLRAFSDILRLHDVHLLIIGDGPLSFDLRVLARQLRVEQSISWLGLQADPSKWLRAIDVFAFPSRLEGSPNALLEAMAMALPVVATEIGGVTDLLDDGEAGLLIPTGDSAALAMELQRLLDDPYLRADLGRRARYQAVERFSLSAHVSRLLELYTSM